MMPYRVIAAMTTDALESFAARMGWPSFHRAAARAPACPPAMAAVTAPPPAAAAAADDDARMVRLCDRLFPGARRPGETVAALERRADELHRAMPAAEAARHLRAGRNLAEARQYDAAQAAPVAAPAPITPAPVAAPAPAVKDADCYFGRGLSSGQARFAAGIRIVNRPSPRPT